MSLPDRLASFFLVKEDEHYPTAYFLILFLVIGAGLAIGRGSADTLFFKRYGIEYLPIMYVSFGVLLSVISATYAAFADRIPAEKFFILINITAVVLLTGCWFLVSYFQWNGAYPIYYLVYEVTSEMMMMHALLYVNQNFETLQAKRLTPLIFAAAQSGKIIGGVVLTFASPVIGVQNFILIWVGLIILSLVIIVVRHRRFGVSPYYRSGRKGRKGLAFSIDQISQGLQFAKRSSLLKSLSFALFFIVIGFYIIVYAVNNIYSETFKTEESLSTLFGILTIANGTVAIFIQLFLTSKLLRSFGIKKINLIFPFTTFISYLLLIVSFTFPVALLASFNKDAIMAGLRNPTRNLFFNALPDYMQGRARALSLAVVLPCSLIITGGLLLLIQTMGESRYFLYVGMLAVILYLYFSIKINSAYVSTIVSTLRERVFLPERHIEDMVNAGSTELVIELKRGINQKNDDISVSFAKLFVKEFPDKALEVILDRMKHADHVLSDRLLKLIINLDLSDRGEELWNLLVGADIHLKATIYWLLFNQKNKNAVADVEVCLNSDNPRLRAVGIYGVHQYNIVELNEVASKLLLDLLENDNSKIIIAGLQILEYCYHKKYQSVLTELLKHSSKGILMSALRVINVWPREASSSHFLAIKKLLLSEDPEIRILAVDCYKHQSIEIVEDTMLTVLEDSHPGVRQHALRVLKNVSEDPAGLLLGWIIENGGTPRAQQSALDGLGLILSDIAIYKRIAEAKMQDALKCFDAMNIIGSDDSTMHKTTAILLQTILEERVHQFVDLSLAALEHVEDRTTIHIIRAGLKSGDSRQVANACEAMRHMKNQQLAKRLVQIYDDEVTLKRKSKRFGSYQDVIQWCNRRLDPWVQTVAKELSLT